MDSNAVFAVLLLLLGLAVLSAEVFIPSGGLLGLITFLSLLVSLVFAYKAWGTSHPNVFWSFCVMLLLLVPTVIGFAFYMLPRTALGKKVLLEAPEASSLAPYLEETRRLEKLIGQFGTAATMMNPGGVVNVEGQRLQAISDGLMIDAGQSVEVIKIEGTQVIVRQGSPKPQQTSASDATNEEPSFDFDYLPNDERA